MRRQLFFICLLLCALMLSGWGGVLAAAVCPHTARAAKSVKMDDDHACCHAKVERAQVASEHCSQASHEAVGETEATRETEPSPEALGPSAQSCSHCVRHNSLPTIPFKMGDAAQHRSDAHHVAAQTLKPITPASPKLVSAIAPTQGAPPGPTARKHLLLGVFLI